MLITRNQVSLNEESFIKRSPFTHGTNGLTFPEYQQNQPWSLVDNVCSPNYDNRKTDDFRSKLNGSGQYWHVISENTWKGDWSLDTRTRDLYDFKCLWHGIEDMESRSNFVICFFFFFSVWWSRQCLFWCRYMFNGTLLMMWWIVRDWWLTKGPCDPSKSYMCVTF